MSLQKDIGNHIIFNDGKIWSKRLKRFIKPNACPRGYLRIDIAKGKKFRVHRLVAEAFIPNPNNYPEVNHINGLRGDNRAENLEWCTPSHNQKHAYRTGLRESKPGELNPSAKLTNVDVKIIRECINKGFKGIDIARYFNVRPTTISMLKRGQNWASI